MKSCGQGAIQWTLGIPEVSEDIALWGGFCVCPLFFTRKSPGLSHKTVLQYGRQLQKWIFLKKGGNGCILLRIFKLKCNLSPQVNNILIVNLAVSDLLLCCVVVPTTLLINVTKRWAGPKIPIFCQVCSLVMFFPAPYFFNGNPIF